MEIAFACLRQFSNRFLTIATFFSLVFSSHQKKKRFFFLPHKKIKFGCLWPRVAIFSIYNLLIEKIESEDKNQFMANKILMNRLTLISNTQEKRTQTKIKIKITKINQDRITNGFKPNTQTLSHSHTQAKVSNKNTKIKHLILSTTKKIEMKKRNHNKYSTMYGYGYGYGMVYLISVSVCFTCETN